MTSAAEDYAQKRHEVLQAEAQVNAAVLLLSEATSRLTNPYPNWLEKSSGPGSAGHVLAANYAQRAATKK